VGREPDWDAEMDVELLLDFLNTVDIEAATDVLGDERAWWKWVADRRLPPSGSPSRAKTVRDALRTSLTQRHTGQYPTVRLPAPVGAGGGAVRVELSGGVPTLVSEDAIGAVLAAATRLAVAGYWERIKICPAEDCRWAFCDKSRNRSRTWCSMRICGNREKARNWRERARSSA